MQKISKMDTVIFSIYAYYHKHKKRMNIIMVIVNVLLLAYYLSFNPILPAGWLLAHEEIWNAIYVVVNPFTTGACILGAIVLIQYVMYDSWIVKGLLSIFYGMVILVSFIAIMGMTSVWELCIYIPHIAVIVLCVIVTCRKQKMRAAEGIDAQDEVNIF